MSWKRRWLFVIGAALALSLVVASHLDYFGGPVGTVVILPGWLVVIDFLQGYDYSLTLLWHYGVAGLVSWGFWTALMWPVIERSTRFRRISVVVALLVLAPVGYLAFRTTEFERDNGELYRFHRSWGFITRVTLDANHDGQIDDEIWYSWREPFLDAHSSHPQRSRSDKNLDGRWDTWVDFSVSQLRVDVDGDEIADHTLTADHDGFEEAKRMRGY